MFAFIGDDLLRMRLNSGCARRDRAFAAQTLQPRINTILAPGS